MAELSVAIPVVGLTSPASFGSRDAIKNVMKKGWDKYGKFFQFASKQSGIPVKAIFAFATAESTLKPDAGSGFTKGIMQANYSYMKSQLENEYKSNRLSQEEKDKLASYGIKFDSAGKTREITQADNLKPELAILLGSIVLGQIVDQPWAKDGNNIRLDKVIVVYNTGLYSKWSKIAMNSKSSTAAELVNQLAGNAVSQAYIRKIMGANGILDIASKELKDVIV